MRLCTNGAAFKQTRAGRVWLRRDATVGGGTGQFLGEHAFPGQNKSGVAEP